MKKLVTLLLAAGLVLSAANGASAVEAKAYGLWQHSFNWGGNIISPFKATKDSGDYQKHFDAIQRMRLGVNFIMSENLSATYDVQIGNFTWGGAPADSLKLKDDKISGALTGQGGNSSENLGGRLGTRSANITTRLAYLDWIVPNTSVKVRMGQQLVALPSYTFGSPVLGGGGATATGIVVSAPITDNIGLTTMWLRADSGWRRANGSAKTTWHSSDNTDIASVIGDLKFDGFRVQPWVTLGFIGKHSGSYAPAGDNGKLGLTGGTTNDIGDNATAWWAGVSGELSMFDPFRLTADFIYNAVNGPDDKADKVSAWYAALGAEYKTAYGTPALKGWYASGDKNPNDTDDHKRGRMLWLFGNFNATNTYYDGGYPLSMYFDNQSTNGTWGLSAQWNNLSFIENLSHSASVTYVKGTNHSQNVSDPSKNYLTTKDSFVELDFSTVYKIYQNLAAGLELGYIIEDFDDNHGAIDYSNAWKAAVTFTYSF